MVAMKHMFLLGGLCRDDDTHGTWMNEHELSPTRLLQGQVVNEETNVEIVFGRILEYLSRCKRGE